MAFRSLSANTRQALSARTEVRVAQTDARPWDLPAPRMDGPATPSNWSEATGPGSGGYWIPGVVLAYAENVYALEAALSALRVALPGAGSSFGVLLVSLAVGQQDLPEAGELAAHRVQLVTSADVLNEIRDNLKPGQEELLQLKSKPLRELAKLYLVRMGERVCDQLRTRQEPLKPTAGRRPSNLRSH